MGRRNSVAKLVSRMRGKFWLASAVAVLSGVGVTIAATMVIISIA